MDVFKLAFETTIVGLLTLVWLGVAAYILFPSLNVHLIGQKINQLLDLSDYKTALGAAVLITAYCLGSAILPIANQLVNDEHWPLNESGIRCQVLVRFQEQLNDARALPNGREFLFTQPKYCSHWAPIFASEGLTTRDRLKKLRRLAAPLPWESENQEEAYDRNKQEITLTLFQQQETAVLSQGADKTESLRQLHERIVVLRGAVFSGFVLSLIFLSAYFARLNGSKSRWTRWIKPVCGILLTLIFITFAVLNGIQDFEHGGIFDIPVLETLLLVITIFGLVVLAREADPGAQFRRKRFVLVAILLTALTYGGWMWSEILYDQQVISAFTVLQTSAQKNLQN